MDSIENKIFRGQVSRVNDYGAFVKLPFDSSKQGLVHRSQISSSVVSDATEVLQPGDSVWCKVIGTENGKISLSMKHVNQGSGADLDPNGVQKELDARNKGKFMKSERQKIELDAIYKTKCSKCGIEGHLSKDCFRTKDGKTYELLSEPEDEIKIFGTEEDLKKRTEKYKKNSSTLKRGQETSVDEVVDCKKSKKRKKEKKVMRDKKKKKKRHRHRSSSSNSSTSST